MIRTAVQLRAYLGSGGTCSKQAVFEGSGFRLVATATGETVYRSALNALLAKDEAQAIATDLCGDPMQWGRA